MLIAHAPAGYLLGRILSRTWFRDTVATEQKSRFYRSLMTASIIGSIFPDFDFIYHLLIDSSRTPHHSYFTHMPVFWVALWLALFAIGKIRRSRAFVAIASAFCLGGLLHLTFDTLTGVVYWFYPLSARGINVFKVADSQRWWVERFTHHWTFIIEIVIVGAAMAVFLRLRETAAEITHLFRRHKQLRTLSLRLAACACGIALVVLVGSMKFSLDNRALATAVEMKHRAAKMIESRESQATAKPRPLTSLFSLLHRRGPATSSGTR